MFEIVLAALLIAFTSGAGLIVQAGSKIRHITRLRKLGDLLRRLGKLLKRKQLNKKVRVSVDNKTKVEAERLEGPKLTSGNSGKKMDDPNSSSPTGPIFNPAGAERAARFNGSQQGVSLRDTVKNIAGDKPVVTYTESGKTIYSIQILENKLYTIMQEIILGLKILILQDLFGIQINLENRFRITFR